MHIITQVAKTLQIVQVVAAYQNHYRARSTGGFNMATVQEDGGLSEAERKRIWAEERERTRANLAARGEAIEAMEQAERSASYARTRTMLKWTAIAIGLLVTGMLLWNAYERFVLPQPRHFR